MTASKYEPLYIGGKRDKARRYVGDDRRIISRREYIKRTEGVTPEEKALARYEAGKAPKGKTVKKELAKQKRKPKPTTGPRKEKYGYKKMPEKLRGVRQLRGRYRLLDPETGEQIIVTGYSKTEKITERKTSKSYVRYNQQALDNALATLDNYDMLIEAVDDEVWLLW